MGASLLALAKSIYYNVPAWKQSDIILCTKLLSPPMKACTTPPGSKNPIRVRWVCVEERVATYPWRLECPTIQWCLGNTFTYILLKSTNDLKNLRAVYSTATKKTLGYYSTNWANQAALVGVDWHTVFGIHDGP